MADLFVIVTGLYFVYIIIHLVSWGRLPQTPKGALSVQAPMPVTKISVIIPARNEENTIARCLHALSVQDYPANLFEIIVVDDHSDDNTKAVVSGLWSVISSQLNGKKGAITEGIRNSIGELIVITDADGVSAKTWLSTIEKAYRDTGAYMLCGPVAIEGEKKFIEKLQSLELCGLSLLSGAGINTGLPLLCNGANIAYTRQVFEEVHGFDGIDGNPSGDDILLMFKIHKKFPGKVAYIKSQDAIVTTAAQPNMRGFLSQRIRWASKGLHAKNVANSLVSTLVFAANLFCLISIVTIISLNFQFSIFNFQLIVLGFAFKFLADFLLLFFAAKFFNKERLLWLFPIAELITILYISWVGIAVNFSSFTWKGRTYE